MVQVSVCIVFPLSAEAPDAAVIIYHVFILFSLLTFRFSCFLDGTDHSGRNLSHFYILKLLCSTLIKQIRIVLVYPDSSFNRPSTLMQYFKFYFQMILLIKKANLKMNQ